MIYKGIIRMLMRKIYIFSAKLAKLEIERKRMKEIDRSIKKFNLIECRLSKLPTRLD